jgi:hypothetical protein
LSNQEAADTDATLVRPFTIHHPSAFGGTTPLLELLDDATAGLAGVALAFRGESRD